jgi:hypothetical protein
MEFHPRIKSDDMPLPIALAVANIFGIFTIAKNVLKAAPRQRRVFGSVGRNTASSPIAGRNAQT